MDTTEKTLEIIKKNDIKPRSNMFFTVFKILNYLLIASGLSIIIALLSLVVFNILEAADLVTLIIVPITAISIFVLLIFIFLFHKTSNSDDFYKFSRYKFAGFLFGLILSGFVIWNVLGTAKAADIALQNNKEYCKIVKKANYVRWSSPENGYLAGEVKEKPVSPKTFMLKDLRRNMWEIHPVETLDVTFVDTGDLVKLRGQVIQQQVFEADQLFFWEGKMWFDIVE